MKLIGNVRFLGILIVPLLLFVVIYFCIRKPDIDFISNNNFVIQKFTDKRDSGNSICTVKILNNQIQTAYKLNNGYEYPYAGILIHQVGAKLFDVDNYILNLVIDANQDFRISIRMDQFLANYSDTAKPLSLLYLVKPIGLKKGENSFQISTKDINEIPDWWFKNNPQKVNDFKTLSLKNTRDIWLFSEFSTPLNTLISFRVKELKLTYNFYPFLYWTLFLSIVYYIILFVLWKFKKEKIKYIFMPIEMTQISDKIPKLQAEILAFIGTSYSNPELKLNDVAMHVGLTQDTTTDLLKRYCNKNFRQYLNQIRMEEAKRLLKESELQIAEIAYKVGYNNIQHFNRVFKEYTSESPKNFREQ